MRASTTNLLDRYFEDVGACGLLTPDEETELAERAAKGDACAVDRLVLANLRFVIRVAKKYQGCGLSLEDLIAEGNVGLIRAAKRFDVARGVKFTSYAVWWIRQAIQHALGEVRMVRLPSNQIKMVIHLNRAENELWKHFGREPSYEEVADRAGYLPHKAERTLQVSRKHLSLYCQLGEHENRLLIDTIADEGSDTPEEAFLRSQELVDIESVMACLSERDATILGPPP